MSLKQVLNELKTTKKTAEAAVAGDLRTRPGRQMAQRQAQAALPGLQAKFRSEFKKLGYPVFLTGKTAQDLATGLKEAADVVTVDLKTSTGDVRNATKQAISPLNREFTPYAFSVLLRELKALGYRLGLKEVPNLSFTDSVYLKTDEKVEAVLDQFLYRDTGPDFVATVLEYDAGTEALNLSGEEKLVPVVILGVPQDLVQKVAAKMFNGKFLEYNVDNPISDQKVEEVLKQVAAANGLKAEETNVEN